MQMDALYRGTVAQAAPPYVGAYMQDYEQEFLVNRLVAAGADSFNILGHVLVAVVQSAALHVPITSSLPPQAAAPVQPELRHEDDQLPEINPEPAEEAAPSDAVGNTLAQRYAWFATVNLETQMRTHVPTLRDVPKCIRGPFTRILSSTIVALADEYRRSAPRLELIEALWKAFVLIPRLLLHPVGRWGREGCEALEHRIAAWDAGQYQLLLEQSLLHSSVRHRRAQGNSTEHALKQASTLVEQGQLSKAALILTSNGVAPGTPDTLAQLRDPQKRPPALTEPLPAEVLSYEARHPLRLDKSKLLANLRSTKRGSAPGPSGARLEHLKPLLEDEGPSDAFAFLCSKYAQAALPSAVAAALSLCHMTALNKDAPGQTHAHGASSRVRGLAVGDVIRRLTGRTLAQQFQQEFEDATAPQQFGLASHGGVEAAVHLIRTLTDADPLATITQIDGIGAYDHIKRSCMLGALARTPTAHRLLPFVMLAYGRQSRYLWRDNEGNCHEVVQGEGGEQGDALMPALFSLGMADALREAQAQLLPNELVIAYLDDVYIVSTPERAHAAYQVVTETIAARCGIQPNLGKTVCWNKASVCPPGIAELGPSVWQGSGPVASQGIRLLGAPLGTPQFIDAFGDAHAGKADRLLQRVLALPSLQHSWLLTYFCLVPRINHLLRQVPPDLVQHTAATFERLTEQALQKLLGGDTPLSDQAVQQARLPFREGGLGFRHCRALAQATYWSSCADVLPTLHQRFPGVVATTMGHLQTPVGQRANHASLDALEQAHTALVAAGIALPSWPEVLQGARPPAPQPPEGDAAADPGEWQHGWQYYTTSIIQSQMQASLLGNAAPPDAARYRSCKGRNNSRWLTAVPYNEALTLSNPVLQCLLRRRLGLPIMAENERCEGQTCQALLDAFGHHRSACTRTGRIHGRHAASLQPWRQVLAEAGYRVRSERLLRDTHIPTAPHDLRRMDLVAAPGSRGLGARRGVALFADVTVVGVHTRGGEARTSAATTDGGVLGQAVAAKRLKYADVVASREASLLVLGCETYGRWCDDATSLIKELVALKAREAPPSLRGCARYAWSQRWWALVSVGVQRAVAEALLRHSGPDLQPNPPEEPPPPLADVLTQQ